jgi:hypothetical protein
VAWEEASVEAGTPLPTPAVIIPSGFGGGPRVARKGKGLPESAVRSAVHAVHPANTEARSARGAGGCRCTTVYGTRNVRGVAGADGVRAKS